MSCQLWSLLEKTVLLWTKRSDFVSDIVGNADDATSVRIFWCSQRELPGHHSDLIFSRLSVDVDQFSMRIKDQFFSRKLKGQNDTSVKIQSHLSNGHAWFFLGIVGASETVWFSQVIGHTIVHQGLVFYPIALELHAPGWWMPLCSRANFKCNTTQLSSTHKSRQLEYPLNAMWVVVTYER